MKKRKLVILFLLGILLINPIALDVYASIRKTINVFEGVNLTIEGVKFIPQNEAEEPVPVFNYNGTTYLPVRAISNFFGEEINWNADTQTVSIGSPELKPGDEVYLGLGIEMSDHISDNGAFYYYSGLDIENKVDREKELNLNGDIFYSWLSQKVENRGAKKFGLSELVIDTDGKYSRFKGILSTGEDYKSYYSPYNFKGIFKYSVIADDKVVFEKNIDISFLNENIDVDIKGVKKLKLRLETTSEHEDQRSGYFVFNPHFVK